MDIRELRTILKIKNSKFAQIIDIPLCSLRHLEIRLKTLESGGLSDGDFGKIQISQTRL